MFYDELTWRGLVHQVTDETFVPNWLNAGSRTVYAGFDPTADSLHVGSLMPLLYLRRFQQAGHRPIALVGGATGMIGDPSGKSDERNLLSVDALRANVVGMEKQMRRFLDFEGENGAVLVNNFDWMRRFSYLDFLRDVGKHFPVNVMTSKDSVKNRLEGDTGISYTEFSYMLLQAYDFVHLKNEYNCELQVGGSDQWGNITAGIDLARRLKQVQLYGLTCPLLTKKDGEKMGKTAKGAVWLSAERTSPYQFYQYLIQIDDEDAGKCLRFLTDVSREEIEALDESRARQPEKKESQHRLAEELTRIVHGDEGLRAAKKATKTMFASELSGLTDKELADVFADVPSHRFDRQVLIDESLNVMDAFVAAGLTKSKGEARRKIQEGGAYINDKRCQGIDVQLGPSHLASETTIVLRIGKKNRALLRFED